jgi:hypothetical protein
LHDSDARRQAKYFAAVYNAFERGSVGEVVHDVSSVTVVRSPMKVSPELLKVYLCLTPAFMPCTADEYKTTRFFSDKEAPLWVSAIVLDTTQ